MCMVLPWIDNGSLRHYTDVQRKTGKLTGGDFVTAVDMWLYQTALGLEYLHHEGIVHGDLHAGNILMDDSGAACLIDFGLSLVAEGTGYNYGSVHGGGAIRWTAPELIDPEEFDLMDSRPTFKSDVFSFAMTCIELYTGRPPFPELEHHGMVQKQILTGRRPNRPTFDDGRTMSDTLWSLMQSCWSTIAAERPSAGEVAQVLAGVVKDSPLRPPADPIPAAVVDQALSPPSFSLSLSPSSLPSVDVQTSSAVLEDNSETVAVTSVREIPTASRSKKSSIFSSFSRLILKNTVLQRYLDP